MILINTDLILARTGGSCRNYIDANVNEKLWHLVYTDVYQYVRATATQVCRHVQDDL